MNVGWVGFKDACVKAWLVLLPKFANIYPADSKNESFRGHGVEKMTIKQRMLLLVLAAVLGLGG
ncbi:hypothetical protein [Methylomonas sp. CM2]|uniref:hypothetical protein n=1 Tax=Methylomonas sp. CM2 TaxID=3417647 RepID=UPI003CEAFBBD